TVTQPTDGTVVINDNGTPGDITDDFVTYTPDNGFIGEETFTYTVCGTDDYCDTATVSVSVGPIIDTVDDTASTPEDMAVDIDVLDNDTGIPGDGTLTVTQPTDGTVVINDNGTPGDITDDFVTYTPDNGFIGTDTFTYTVCDTSDTCDSAMVTITVGPIMTIDAVDDDYSADPVDGLIGGIVTGSNVYDNDTLNGEPVNPDDVTLTSTPTGPLTINPDGTVDVAANTPDGTYTIEYTICENAVPTNCDSAMVTVVVIPPPIDAVEDDFSANPVYGPSGGLVVGSNVYDNDTLNGEPVNAVDVTLTSTPTGPLTVNTDGTVEIAPNTSDGTYTIEYTICENLNPTNCDTATVIVSVESILVNQMVTPNFDGDNDFLFIRGVDQTISNSIKIFNRWGVAVFEGKDYDNQRNIFDGRSKARSTLSVQEYLPAGIYFYIFEYQLKNQVNVTDSGYLYLSK
ncbi:MAG: Ig-like domain-containing protein, partial [Maribacter sp.]|nr:Ig-like domain-containing protein [Maribacter sp.]